MIIIRPLNKKFTTAATTKTTTAHGSQAESKSNKNGENEMKGCEKKCIEKCSKFCQFAKSVHSKWSSYDGSGVWRKRRESLPLFLFMFACLICIGMALRFPTPIFWVLHFVGAGMKHATNQANRALPECPWSKASSVSSRLHTKQRNAKKKKEARKRLQQIHEGEERFLIDKIITLLPTIRSENKKTNFSSKFYDLLDNKNVSRLVLLKRLTVAIQMECRNQT